MVDVSDVISVTSLSFMLAEQKEDLFCLIRYVQDLAIFQAKWRIVLDETMVTDKGITFIND